MVAVTVKTSNAGAAEQEPRAWRMKIIVQKSVRKPKSPTWGSWRDRAPVQQCQPERRRKGREPDETVKETTAVRVDAETEHRKAGQRRVAEPADEATKPTRAAAEERRRACRARQAQAPYHLVAGDRLRRAARTRVRAGVGAAFLKFQDSARARRQHRPGRIGRRQPRTARSPCCPTNPTPSNSSSARPGPAHRRVPRPVHVADEERGDPRREGEADLGGGVDPAAASVSAEPTMRWFWCSSIRPWWSAPAHRPTPRPASGSPLTRSAKVADLRVRTRLSCDMIDRLVDSPRHGQLRALTWGRQTGRSRCACTVFPTPRTAGE